jgi:uncharacterized protein (TIGR00251 family)
LNPKSYGIEAVATGVVIHVYVAPRSSANKVVGAHNGALKVALTAPPVEGAANKALLEFLSKLLGVSQSSLVLVSGETSRNKIVRVEGISAEDALRKLSAVGSR